MAAERCLCSKTEKVCEGAVEKNLWCLKYAPVDCNTDEMCEKVVKDEPCVMKYVPDHFKTQEMCEEAASMHSDHEKFRTPCGLLLPMPSILLFIADHFKTQEMCSEADEKNPLGLDEAPDHFKT